MKSMQCVTVLHNVDVITHKFHFYLGINEIFPAI